MAKIKNKIKIGGWKWKDEVELTETPIYIGDYKTSLFKVKKIFRTKIVT